MRVILDQQHTGKPGKADVGATHDLDKDGTVELGEREIDLTGAYIDAAASALRRGGHTVVILSSGSYAERHDQVVRIARLPPAMTTLYCACHINSAATPGAYALVEYDAASKAGKLAAEIMAEALGALPEVSVGKTRGLGPSDRGHVCVAGIFAGPAWLTGSLLEPGFINEKAHATLWTPEGLVRVGEAVATGCVRYAEAAGG